MLSESTSLVADGRCQSVGRKDREPLVDSASATELGNPHESREALARPVSPDHRTARSWARAAAYFWAQTRSIDFTQPLYILEIAPDSPKLAGLIMGALEDELPLAGLNCATVRYLLCKVGAVRYGATYEPQQHTLATQHRVDGRHDLDIEHAHWSGVPGSPIMVGAARKPVFGTRNPIVTVSWFGLSSFPSIVATLNQDLSSHVVATDQSRKHRANLSNHSAAVLAHYDTTIQHGRVRIPAVCIDLYSALCDISGGRYLHLALDSAFTEQDEVAMDALAQEQGASGGYSSRINFHALQWHMGALHAQTETLAAGRNHLAIHLSCCFDAKLEEHAQAVARRMADIVDAAHPGDWQESFPQHASTIGSLSMSARATDRGEAALASLAEAIEESSRYGETLQRAERSALARYVRRLWLQTRPQALDGALLHSFLCVASLTRDWELLRRQLAHGSLLPSTVASYHRAVLALETGDNEQAIEHLEAYLEDKPQDTAASQTLAFLCSRSEQRARSPWHSISGIKGAQVSLERLDELHHRSYLEMFEDPSLPRITGLHPVQTVADLRLQSLDDARAGRTAFAIMHKDTGFVGSIGVCVVHRDVVHLDYWVGAKYQGDGHCSEAVGLLLDHLDKLGVIHFYAQVSLRNPRSLRLLQSAGFTPLEVSAVTPEMSHLLMHRCRPGASDPRNIAHLGEEVWKHCMD